MKKIIGITIVVVLVVMQFFQIDKTNPPEQAGMTMAELERPPAQIAALLENACYDCHSYQTEYPWYFNVQPVAWWLRGHIRGARMNMNFSEWGSYSAEERKDYLEECAEEIEDGHMPPSSYRNMHAEAKLSEQDKEKLIGWLNANSD